MKNNMKWYWRFILILTIVWLLVASLWVPALGLILLYLLYYNGYELILIGILLDGYYQYFYSVPFFSLCISGMVLLMNVIKPRLLLYNAKNEVAS